MRTVIAALAGFVLGAGAAFFLAGPAVLADGADIERVATGFAAVVACAVLAVAVRIGSGARWAGAAVAAGALTVVAMFLIAEPDAWPIAVPVGLGIAATAWSRPPHDRPNGPPAGA